MLQLHYLEILLVNSVGAYPGLDVSISTLDKPFCLTSVYERGTAVASIALPSPIGSTI